MIRQSFLVLGLVVVMVGSAAGFLQYVRGHQKLGRPGIKLADRAMYDSRGKVVCTNSIDLPEKVLDYSSEIPPIDEVVLTWLPKDTTYGQRLYHAPDGFNCQISVVLMGSDRTSIHKPEYCLPAQGWTIEKTEPTSIPIAQPHPYSLSAMKYTSIQEKTLPGGQKVTRRGINVIWFVTDQQLASKHNEWMWSMMKHLVLTGELQRWAYVICTATCIPGQEDATYERLKKTIAAAVPQFQMAAGPPSPLVLNNKP